MKYEILINSIFRLPLSKANKILEYYQVNIGFKSSEEQEKVLDIITNKNKIRNQITTEQYEKIYENIIQLNNGTISYESSIFNNYNNYSIMFWIEIIDKIDITLLKKILDKYVEKLPSFIIETIIINLSKQIQEEAIQKYNSYLDLNQEMFYSFYYSLKKESREYLKRIYHNKIPDDSILKLKDMQEKQLFEILINKYDKLIYKNPNSIVEVILEKISQIEFLNIIFKKYKKLINKCSNSKFKKLFSKYKELSKYNNLRITIIDDYELFDLFKEKFLNLGIVKTIKLFDRIKYYDTDDFTVHIVLELLNYVYLENDLLNIINNETMKEIIKRYVEKCKQKKYRIKDLEKTIRKIKNEKKQNIISKEYIKAIIECKQLLNQKIIDDKSDIYIETRNLFSNDLINRCYKDETTNEKIQLNNVFYRLIKESLSFELVYSIKTYKGLIYLSKYGKNNDNVDLITRNFNDNQILRLNLNKILRITRNIDQEYQKFPNQNSIDKMGIQLYCLFGLDKAKYLLESNIEYQRMENLFDQIKYNTIEINGENPKLKEDFIVFLFGKGNMKEPCSNINKLIRKELPNFEKYFSEFRNNLEKIVEECNGVISVKRILKYFDNIEFPIELKPDEVMFKKYLKELNTTDQEILKDAIEICKNARKRKYSSIPKIDETFENFTYKMLDLKDPFAITVGYLTHCCFLIKGISYESLKHALQSKNGRIFAVFYNQKFIAQSWIWRNGNVACFDSVEYAQAFYQLQKEEQSKLLEIYKKAAQQIINISNEMEPEAEKIKLVTVGRTNNIFNNLEDLTDEKPKPLEPNLYTFDSQYQKILTSSDYSNLNYGDVKVQYKDPRKNAEIIDDFNNIDIDKLDDILININSLRYQLENIDSPLDYNNYKKIISQENWYILVDKNGNIESQSLNDDEETIIEYNKFLSKVKEETKY